MHVCTFYPRSILLCIFDFFLFKLRFDNLLINENDDDDDDGRRQDPHSSRYRAYNN